MVPLPNQNQSFPRPKETPDKPKRRRWRKIAIALVLLLVLYSLSMGPMAWLVVKGYVPIEYYDAMLPTIYWPLLWLTSKSDVAKHLLDFYLRLFY